MKMLKKAAAVLLAAAMSLVMLTACGGGSGSTTQYKLAKVLAESQQTGKMYTDITTEIDGAIINSALAGRKMKADVKTAVNSKTGKTCTFVNLNMSGDSKYLYMTTGDGNTYEISENGTDGAYWKKVSDKAMLGVANAAVPSDAVFSKLQIKPEYEYNGQKYYAEVLTVDGAEIAYLFSGDTWVYTVITMNGITIAEKINEVSGKFPATIDSDLPFSFDEVMNFPIK